MKHFTKAFQFVRDHKVVVVTRHHFKILMQAVKTLSKQALPIGNLATLSLHCIAWQVDQPISRLQVKSNHKPYELCWSVRSETESVVYMRRACCTFLHGPHSPANAAIQDAAVVQECLQTYKATKIFKLETTSALSFPLINDASGEHAPHKGNYHCGVRIVG